MFSFMSFNSFDTMPGQGPPSSRHGENRHPTVTHSQFLYKRLASREDYDVWSLPHNMEHRRKKYGCNNHIVTLYNLVSTK